MPGPVELAHPEARITLNDLGNGVRRIEVHRTDGLPAWVRNTCETRYPTELIRLILDRKGPGYLCDEIKRDEDPAYMEHRLERAIQGYVPKQDFVGKRILDFGCGSGASSMILKRFFPDSSVTGIDLEADLLKIAEARQAHYRFDDTRFVHATETTRLPPNIGTFHFVTLNAVYEHLLPNERTRLLPQLWAVLEPNGVLFLNGTPNRAFHVEGHTTNLYFLNYMPDRLAHAVTRRFSYRFNDDTWEELLRKGIRGGTVREVVRMLGTSSNFRPDVMEPNQFGLRDRIDLHEASRTPEKNRKLKYRALRAGLKTIRRLTGVTYCPALTLAIRKTA